MIARTHQIFDLGRLGWPIPASKKDDTPDDQYVSEVQVVLFYNMLYSELSGLVSVYTTFYKLDLKDLNTHSNGSLVASKYM